MNTVVIPNNIKLIDLSGDFRINDYKLYEIIMESYKEFELLTYISIEQEIQIQKLREKNKKFKFNGVGNKDEFERIFGIINNNIRFGWTFWMLGTKSRFSTIIGKNNKNE